MTDWFAKLQNALPQHAMSRLLGTLATNRTPWLSRALIHPFAKAYDVDMSEALVEDLDDYSSFNEFFTRALKTDARPIDANANAIVSPADGVVSQLGAIEDGQLFQAKGHQYPLHQLAGSLSDGMAGGSFVTIYLAPRDYHRVHNPFTGELTASLAVPGALYSVNEVTERSIPGLFCRNERLVCRFDTSFGPMLVVLVGALIVASIETVWPGPHSPYTAEELTHHGLNFDRGEELGRFLLGSTVICCFPRDTVSLSETLSAGDSVRMGQAIATTTNPKS